MKKHDHGNSSDSRNCAHHWAHHARRRGGRLQGVPYTTRKEVTNLSSLQVTVDKQEAIPLTPILGRWALVVDMALQMEISSRLREMRLKKDGTLNRPVEIDLYPGI